MKECPDVFRWINAYRELGRLYEKAVVDDFQFVRILHMILSNDREMLDLGASIVEELTNKNKQHGYSKENMQR